MSQLGDPPEQHEKAARLPQSEQHGDTLPSSSGPSATIVKQSERRAPCHQFSQPIERSI